MVVDDALPDASVLMADGGRVRKTMEARNVVPVLALRKSRRRCVEGDGKLSRLRNPVQRCFEKLKNATRFDKTAESLPGLIDIASTRL